MGFNPQSPSPPHLYSQELQLKLYQAFIFSIPILFSIILFLLFYLFYLKKRVSTVSSPSANLPRSSNQAALVDSSVMNVMEILKEKLPIILFDEQSKARETLCCVCLGEFEVKEELHQLPSCKHVFHIDCIRHWLHSNSTCPLCRCSVIISIKNSSPESLASGNNLLSPDTQSFNQSPRMVYAEQQEQLSIVVTRVEDCTGEHQNEGSSGSSDYVCNDSGQNQSHAESVIISIQSSDT